MDPLDAHKSPQSSRRILGIFAHPDDESYAAAGTLGTCARAGHTVHLLCATGDSQEEPRAGELRAAARILGAEVPIFLGLSDGQLHEIPEQRGCALLHSWLERLRPEVVVTLGDDGAYGHRDHLQLTRWVRTACRESNWQGRLLLCAFPRGLFAPVHSRLRKVLGHATVPLEASALGSPRNDADLVVRLDPEAARLKRSAVACHRSQLPPSGDPMEFLRPGTLSGLLEEEWFTLAAGPALPRRASEPFAGLGCAG